MAQEKFRKLITVEQDIFAIGKKFSSITDVMDDWKLKKLQKIKPKMWLTANFQIWFLIHGPLVYITQQNLVLKEVKT